MSSLSPDSTPYPVENPTGLALPMRTESSKPTSSEAKVPQKSTCLFCSNPVLVVNQEPDSDAAVKWSKIIKALCYHIQLWSKHVPKLCTTTAFPLCKPCELHAVKIFECQKKVDEAQRTISKTICAIEQKVANGEILRETVQTGSVSVEGKKLRDTILEGHRAKLLMKAKLLDKVINGMKDEGKILEMPSCTPDVIMLHLSIRRQFIPEKIGVPAPGTSQSNNASQLSACPTVGLSLAKNGNEQEEQTGNTSGGNNESADVCTNSVFKVPAARVPPDSTPSGMVVTCNENTCTMTITKEDCASQFPTDTSIKVKQEPGSLPPVPVQDNKRKRRCIFQGIEILKYSDPKTNKVYLKCSICEHAILLSNTFKSNASPHQAMTQHITNKHLGKRKRVALHKAGPTRVTRNMERKASICKICFMIFEDLKTLLSHEATHFRKKRSSSSSKLMEALNLKKKPRFVMQLHKRQSKKVSVSVTQAAASGSLTVMDPQLNEVQIVQDIQTGQEQLNSLVIEPFAEFPSEGTKNNGSIGNSNGAEIQR